jgi:hypothetical protein
MLGQMGRVHSAHSQDQRRHHEQGKYYALHEARRARPMRRTGDERLRRW